MGNSPSVSPSCSPSSTSSSSSSSNKSSSSSSSSNKSSSSNESSGGSGNGNAVQGGRKEWYKKSELKDFYKRVREGDLMEIDRGKYAHWVVVVEVRDEGVTVIHITGDKGIIKSELEEILGEDQCRVNNENDETKGFVINSQNVTVNCAYHFYKFPEEFGTYNVLIRNCQHFANRCRYQQHVSRQVEKITNPFARTDKKQLLIN